MSQTEGSRTRTRQGPITIASHEVAPGKRVPIDIPVAMLYTHTPVTLSLQVKRGHFAGPTLFLSAAIHGDELNGVEIIRRVLNAPAVRHLRGTLIAAPIVNVFGFLNRSRYLPDRRDLNRTFPGSPNGSLASRLAHLFMAEVVDRCDYGIDLHTGSLHRSNLPQIRAHCCDLKITEMAQAFGVPVILNTTLRSGSLRHAATERGVQTILYECGEALRFDEMAIRAGVRGVLNVMKHLGMIRGSKLTKPPIAPLISSNSSWLRAPISGMFRHDCALGAHVEPGQLLATVSDPIGASEVEVVAQREGIVIGSNNLPVVNQGDALFHVAFAKNSESVEEKVDIFHEELDYDSDSTKAVPVWMVS
ncbi:MAG: succinylglutamate desuccinylase/aspartoacylase family protein [Magnetococcales bacterium]|nr:succinylglutamate desuccinylase/aspartoacylase family protein [Magnetococcales bacterium]